MPSLLEFDDVFAFDFLGEVDETDGGVLFGQLDGGSRPVVALACAGADDDGTGDAVLVPIVTGPDDLQAVIVGGEHQIRLDVFAEKLAPFTVDVGLEVAADEGDVADDESVFHAFRIVFVGGVRDDALQIFRLLQAEGMAGDRVAVCVMAVGFVFATAEGDVPDRADAEREV